MLTATRILVEIQETVRDMPLDEPAGWVIPLIVGIMIPAGLGVGFLGVRQIRNSYRIFRNDPVGAGEVYLEGGVVEVEGTAKPLDRTLTGKYSNEPALAQSWRRERKQKRTDSDGNTKTSWRTVSRGEDSVPFVVEDKTGEVAVDPAGANLSINQSRVRSGGWLRFGRNGRYREYEGRIEPGDSVHVYGEVRSASTDADAPTDDATYIGNGEEVSEFVISDGSELRTVLRYFGRGLLLVVVAVLWIPLVTIVFLFMIGEVVGIPIGSWLLETFG
ncbi:MAG: GIDE domain-containing protein [Natronomonas sp.]